MCRFVLYLGPPIRLSSLVTEPGNSIIHQSFHSHEREEPLNGDGFGVAWYEHALAEEPGVFRAITPAWSNRNLHNLARMTESTCVLAHVRAASPGLPVTETNTHPFTWGRYAFMHNGELGSFLRIKRRLLATLSDATFDSIAGSTDSEHLFALFRERLVRQAAAGSADGAGNGDGAEAEAEIGVEAMAAALDGAIGDALALSAPLGEPSYLNVAVSDGRRAVACRFTNAPPEEALSLYLHTGRRYVCEEGLCRMIAPEEGRHAVIVSSEPLSDDPGWQRVPVNHRVLVHADRVVDVRPMALAGRAARVPA